ncbi:hypothetical protein [Burkholderia ubonensis]|uniref:hypothetical protein n=1 Tax=Burkholderia ubonensis TaxID=101571 RepID=UPI000B2F7C7B|nr:hypothetical protein [Burkholderia ubonensis]
MLTTPTARERLERSLPFMSSASADACKLLLAGHLTGLTPHLRGAIQRTGNVIADKLASDSGISITDLLRIVRREATTTYAPISPVANTIAQTSHALCSNTYTVCSP